MKIKQTIAVLILFICSAKNSFGQYDYQSLPQLASQFGSRNFYDIKDSMDHVFYEIAQQYGDSILLGEGSEYGSYQRWLYKWEKTLYPDGSFARADSAFRLAQTTYCNSNTQHPSASWVELGPTNQPSESSLYNTGRGVGTGRANWICFNPNNNNKMLIGSVFGGLFKTTDGGDTWSNAGTDQLCNIATPSGAISYQNSDHWLMGNSDGVWRTQDAGANWELIGANSSIPNIGSPDKILVDPLDENILYVAASGGLFKTTNAWDQINPVAWTNLTFATFNWGIYDVEFKPGSNSMILYASGTHLIMSTNYGATWATMPGSGAITTSTSRIAMEITPADPNILYAVFVYSSNPQNSKLWRYDYISSTTGTWTDKGVINNGGPIGNVRYGIVADRAQSIGVSINTGEAGLVFIGDIEPACKCTTGTNNSPCSWIQISSNQTHDDIHSIKMAPNGTDLWAMTDGGAFKSTNTGSGFTTWSAKNNGLGLATPDKMMAVSPNDPDHFVVGMFDCGVNSYNANNTNNWTHGSYGDALRSAIDNNDTRYMYGTVVGGGNFSTTIGGVMASSDYGASFSKLYSFGSTWAENIIINAKNPTILYQFAVEVKRNTNRGIGASSAWTNISQFNLMNPSESVGGIYSSPLDEKILLVRTSGNGNRLYITTNADVAIPTWTLISQPTIAWIAELVFDYADPQIFYVVFDGYIANEKIYKYNGHNIGTNSWTNLSFNLNGMYPLMLSITLEKGSDEGLYIGTGDRVFYTNNKRITNNSGSEWIEFNTNLPHVPKVSDLKINYVNNKIYAAAGGRGIWYSGLACPSDYDLTLTGTHTDYFYEAQHDIHSTALVNNGVNVKYRGGNAVEMNPGFMADAGSTFVAYIHPCNQPGNSFRAASNQYEETTQDKDNNDLFKSLLIYPNPTKGLLSIVRTAALGKEEEADDEVQNEKIKIDIFDMIGRTVFNSLLSSKFMNIDLSNFNKGLYIVKLTDENGRTEIRKIILE